MLRLFAVIAILLSSASAQLVMGPDKDPCEMGHPSGVERWRNVRVLNPQYTKVIAFDGKRLEVFSQDSYFNDPKTLEISPETRLPKDFTRTYKKGTYLIVYCEAHRHVYSVDVYAPRVDTKSN
jgi:hypothetical protein